MCEVGVCLEVRIGLGHGEELTQGSGKSIVGFHLFVGRVCGDGGIAGGDNGLESLFLVFGVALDRLDQICNQIAAALELRVDVLPSVIDAIAQRNEVIVDANYRANDSDDDDDANDDRNHECSVSVMRRGENHAILPRMIPTVYPPCKINDMRNLSYVHNGAVSVFERLDLMDLRVQKTYRALFAAFTELLEEHRFEDVTVAMLCDRAMIRRTTFYKHFADKTAYFSFYVDSLCSNFVERVTQEQAAKAASVDERQAIFQMLIDFFLEHEKLMDNVLTSSVSAMLTFKICETVSGLIRSRYASELSAGEDQLDLLDPASDFIAGGIMRLIRMWWASDDRRENEEHFVQVSNVLVTRVLENK